MSTRQWGRSGGLARAAQTDMRELGRKGGQACVEKHGRSHMAKIGKRGYWATVNKYFGGNKGKADSWLTRKGLFVSDPCPWNGAWRDPGPHPAEMSEEKK